MPEMLYFVAFVWTQVSTRTEVHRSTIGMGPMVIKQTLLVTFSTTPIKHPSQTIIHGTPLHMNTSENLHANMQQPICCPTNSCLPEKEVRSEC